MTDRTKVFCIGFHKTGTTSLYAALTTLGYRVSGTFCHKMSAEDIAKNGASLCIDRMQEFDAAEDMPWPHFYRDLDKAYPGSKFVLTTRDKDAWFRSIDNHFGHQETPLNASAYGASFAKARDNKDHWQSVYAQHYEDVRNYFKDRPDDLLELDLAAGDGWQKLCPFLDQDIPSTPFPVKNTSATRQSLAYRVKRKLWIWAGRTPHPERLV